MSLRNPRCRHSAGKLTLIFLVALGTTVTAKNNENDESREESKKIIEKPLKEDTSEIQIFFNQTTTNDTIKSIVSTNDTSTDKHDKSVFKPSILLGEITEPRIRTNPFNTVYHVKFNNSINPDTYGGQYQSHKITAQHVAPPVQGDRRENFHQNIFEGVPEIENQDGKQGITQNGYVKFQDDAVDVPKIPYENVFKYPSLFAEPSVENAGSQYELMNQFHFDDLEKPTYNHEVPSTFRKPTKFQGDTQNHELVLPMGFQNVRQPSFNGYYDYKNFNYQPNYQPVLHDFEALKKPDKSVVYVQESSFTRTRKFPYSYYQPPIGYHEIEFVDNAHSLAAYPARQRISPWKKILHLIGAFLPLGLLLATLTPNVVKINNTTEPNIVLSKLRVADLPVEHKQAQLRDVSSYDCEEKTLCELISAGQKAESNLLQNIMWNFVARTSEKTAKENGLQEIFEAAKKQDCERIICGYSTGKDTI